MSAKQPAGLGVTVGRWPKDDAWSDQQRAEGHPSSLLGEGVPDPQTSPAQEAAGNFLDIMNPT